MHQPSLSLNKYKSGPGFTLVEMLVVTVIFMMVFVFSYSGLRSNRRLNEFRLAADQLASNIRKVQTMALAGIADEDLGNIAYGIAFATVLPTEYRIFIDENSNGDYDPPDEKIVQTITLPEDITIWQLLPNNGGTLAIVFSPPKPTIYINGSTVSGTATIKLQRSNLTGKGGQIIVNRITGRITSELVDI